MKKLSKITLFLLLSIAFMPTASAEMWPAVINQSMHENIKAYPTWEFADGTRVEGVIPLQALSEKTKCSL